MSTNDLINIHDFVRSRGLNRIVASQFIATHPEKVRRVVTNQTGGRPQACVSQGADFDALKLVCDRLSSFPRPPLALAMNLAAEQTTNG